jgi:hypothetical protein
MEGHFAHQASNQEGFGVTTKHVRGVEWWAISPYQASNQGEFGVDNQACKVG